MKRNDDTIPKTITPTELRRNIYGVVHEVAQKGDRYLVVPDNGESVVICSRAEYNSLIAERRLLRDLREAEADVAAGRTHSIADVRQFVSGSTRARTARRRKA